MCKLFNIIFLEKCKLNIKHIKKENNYLIEN